MSKYFNEATRVQMPAMMHLLRLGYKYYGKLLEEDAGTLFDRDTNILIDVFLSQFKKLNPSNEDLAEQTLKDIRQELDNNDLGKKFYKRLTSVSPVKLIDFDNINNNDFHFTAEFTCRRDEEEFRPDITLFINGLPLSFIEVKRPNNKDGLVAESERMNNIRFPNRKFRRFINITQLMIFSNNMEYDTLGGIVPVQGAFYCTASKDKAFFSVFREENPLNEPIAPFISNYPYIEIDKKVEKKILTDFNNQVIHLSPEYQTNLNINTPTNRIITSMCSKERLIFIIKYGIAYVNSEREVDGKIEVKDQKHIMRYQQLFATLAIREKLSENINSGVIWHTQGSGKTALSFHLNYVLTDFYAKQNKVAKFYFIVDRLDLLEQATQEFEARGLEVKTANSKSELMQQFRTNQSLEGSSGKNEITVVNIHKFDEDKEKVMLPDYSINLQRVFIIDEAHRGYNPKGSFLANLFEADPNSIKIALTGTPLLKEERASWKVFGNYYHTYYYDKSIQDGYTLKVIREPVETSYKEKLSEIYERLETLVRKKDVPRSNIVEHDSYVKELLRYIIFDLKKFRQLHGDDSLGGMVICETSDQARKLVAYFDEIQEEQNLKSSMESNFKIGLILHDSDDKEIRKQIISDFKKNMTVDILFVFNMLLTGFDAPRLKRLYFGRKLRDHNLLQALTRVNRPYKDNRYGYIVDFADIKDNFQETNEAYVKELNRFNDPDEVGLGNETNTYNQIIENPEKLLNQIQEVKSLLFSYTTENTEIFSSEISTIEDKKILIDLRKALISARDCFNIVRTFGDKDLKEKFTKIEIVNLASLITEVQYCINNINQKEMLEESDTTKQLINEAMQDITFRFNSLTPEEMRIIANGNELENKWKQSIHAFTQNIDQDDPEYITLRQAFLERFKEKGFVIDSVDTFEKYNKELEQILKRLMEIHVRNKALLNKYNGDTKYVRLHKRIREENINRNKEGKDPIISKYENEVNKTLLIIKNEIDQKVYNRNDILRKDEYFERTVMQQITTQLDEVGVVHEREDRIFIQTRLAKQYLNQYNATYGGF